MIFVYFAIGRLLIWIFQSTKIFSIATAWSGLLRELRSCDLCSGFWIYLFLSWLLEVKFLDEFIVLNSHVIIVVVDHLVTAIISSFLMYVFVRGWQSEFSTLVME